MSADWKKVGIGVAALAGWEVLARVTGWHAEDVPSPSRVLMEIVSSGSKLKEHGLFTAGNLLSGYLLGVSCALPCAALVSFLPRLGRILAPALNSHARLLLPVLFPLFFVWLGVGAAASVLVVYLLALVTATSAFLRGFGSVTHDVNELVRSMGMGPVHVFFQVGIPASLPYGFGGMREAVYMSMLGVTVAEFAEADRGLGHLMLMAAVRLEPFSILAALTVFVAIGAALLGMIRLIEFAFLPRQKTMPGR